MKTEYICDFCGFEISSSEYDKLDTIFFFCPECPECGGRIQETEVSKPIMVSTDRDQDNPSLITCELCQQKFSKRALKCPKCEWVPIAICEICKNKIPFDSTTCIECGDPNPFLIQTNPSPMPVASSADNYVGATLGFFEALGGYSISDQVVCQHCGKRGCVATIRLKAKKGVSGAKATGALLTGGLSILATGLSRKEWVTHAKCKNCDSQWQF